VRRVNGTEPRALLDLALRAARAGGAHAAAARSDGVEVTATKSSEVDIVTAADRETERLVRELLLGERPDDAILGEEGSSVEGSTGVRWIVDPIDGTVNYLYGLGQYAVSIAAEVEGQVVAGVVLDVAKDETYAGVRLPDGAVESTLDGRPLGVRGPAPLAQRLIATGFSYEPERRAIQGRTVAHLLTQVRDIRRFGSCALDLCAVAAGRLDGYLEEGVNPWDHAAGCLVAEGAGARWELTAGAGGGPLLMCAPAHGFDELRAAALAAGFLARSGE
jgi:myo-inositol-1(or 4)-monophosphatase